MDDHEHQQQSTSSKPTLIARSSDINGKGNYTFGCACSPDGLCVLTSTSADNSLRLYNTPHSAIYQDKVEEYKSHCDSSGGAIAERGQPSEDAVIGIANGNHEVCEHGDLKPILSWESSLVAKEGDSIRGYAWYPLMNSYDPSTCIFLCTSRLVLIYRATA